MTSGQIYHDMPEQFPCHNLTLDLNTKNEATDDFSKHVELLVRVCINSVWSKMGIYGIPLLFFWSLPYFYLYSDWENSKKWPGMWFVKKNHKIWFLPLPILAISHCIYWSENVSIRHLDDLCVQGFFHNLFNCLYIFSLFYYVPKGRWMLQSFFWLFSAIFFSNVEWK